MTHTELKDAVMYLLRTAAEAKLEGERADYTVGFEVSRLSRATRGWGEQYDAAVAEREPAALAEYEAAAEAYERRVRELMRAEWADLRSTGIQRLKLALGNRHLPADLRAWAKRQYGLALMTRNAWAVAFVILTLRDVVEWESAHDADAADNSALGQVQAEWVAKHTLEAGEWDGPETLSGAGTGHVRVVGESRGAK